PPRSPMWFRIGGVAQNNPSPTATHRGVDMPVPQADRNEDAKQADAIASLARETHHPVPVVRRVFEAEYSRLKANAPVTDHLMLCAPRPPRATWRPTPG